MTLASTSVVTNQGGGSVAQQLYKPWGESRWASGTLPTDRKLCAASRGRSPEDTGQRSEEATLGSLYDYGARAYSPRLGRFLSADTIVPEPGDPQALNRYSYTRNNPTKLVDPTGHAWALPDWDGTLTPVGILNPNRMRSDDERNILFAWFDANPGYNPATDPVLRGETRAQPLELGLTHCLLAMEHGFWQVDRGDRGGLDTVGAGLMGAVVVLGPGAGSGIPGQNQGPTTYRGGAYGKIQTKGLEAHHMPPDSTTGIPTKLGPAIQMDRSDHRLTSSWGPGATADAHRARIKALVDAGRMRDAMAVEIWDIRRVAGSKYNSAIQEMLDYARRAGFIWK